MHRRRQVVYWALIGSMKKQETKMYWLVVFIVDKQISCCQSEQKSFIMVMLGISRRAEDGLVCYI